MSVSTGNGEINHYNGAGQLHRVDGPAHESEQGEKWYYNGELHRIGGPAVVSADGTSEWWQNGQLVTPVKPDRRATHNIDDLIDILKQVRAERGNVPIVYSDGQNWAKFNDQTQVAKYQNGHLVIGNFTQASAFGHI